MKGEETNNDGYPRVLDREGCLFGRALREKVDDMDKKIDKMVSKIDKMTQVLVAMLISIATAAVLLALNLALGNP